MISAVILVKNNEKTIQATLDSLSFLSDIVVIDTGSSDNTLSIIKQYPQASIYQENFIGFGPLRNIGSKKAMHDWILAIDSDEVLSPEVIRFLKHGSFTESTIYSFPFHNFFNGKWIKWCGWYPDYHPRLYHKKHAHFSNEQVHEKLIHCCNIIQTTFPIYHYSYSCTSDFLRKMEVYSSLFAAQYAGKKRSSLWHALFHGFFSFFKSYIIKRGFLGRKEGFIISLYNGHTAYYKYLKLDEANNK